MLSTSILNIYLLIFVHYLLTITVISGRLPARPITRTGRLLHTAKKKSQQITRTGG